MRVDESSINDNLVSQFKKLNNKNHKKCHY